MITVAKRAMTAEELSEAKRIEGDVRSATGCAVACWVFLVALPLVPACGLMIPAVRTGHLEFGRTVMTLAVVMASIVGWIFWPELRAYRTTLENDIVSREVELLHVHAFSCVTVPNAFFFDVGDGQLIFTRGPYLHAAIHSARFPNRYFTLVRLPLSRKTLRVDCHGEPITAPAAPPGPEVDFEMIPDAALIPAKLETVRQDLAALLAKGWKPA